MKSKMTVLSAVALAMCLATSRNLRADDLRIAVCNPMKVLQNMQEFKDLEAKTKADGQQIQAQLTQKKDAIKTMQDSLNLLLPDSPQYAQQNEDLLKASIDYKNTVDLANQHMMRQQKLHVKALFDKIQDEAGKVAQQKGYTMVISSHQPDVENLDNIDLQNLATALVIQRVVLYNDPKLDITQDVLVALDKDYNSSGGGGSVPSSPAPPEPTAPSGH
jgi:Skp family chaperone for outer membrane proteins